jgi:alpha-N-arabinofuranosidase
MNYLARLRFPVVVVTFLLLFSQFAVAQSSKVTNPILAGFYPDPSICRAGNDYYLVNSTFSYYPGLPLFHSTDLVNWKQIGFAMNRPEQLNLDSLGLSLGLFAPAIRYNKGTFYITCTLVGKQGNFIITTRNPKGPWSNPIWLPPVKGIDPTLFFDDDGKIYIVFNSRAPDDKPLYDGHCTIRLYELDPATLQVKGEEKILVNGGTDISKHPRWIEGPHLYKNNGYYYLMCAEGGTEYNHSEVIFRSKKVDGPYESYSGNPILTQRQLDANRKRPVTSTGHADLVASKDGHWYAVFLGCRPYAGDYYNTGRETFMTPVQWKDGWPIILPGNEPVPYSFSIPGAEKNSGEYNSDFYFKDDFKSPALSNRYQFLRTVRAPWYHVNNVTGSLSMRLQPLTCSGKGNPSFVGYRQSNMKGYAATTLSFTPANANEKAGLLVFQNEQHYYFLCRGIENNQPVVQLYRGPGNANAGKEPDLMLSQKIQTGNHWPLQLKIQANGSTYAFYYADGGNDRWKLLKDGVDATFLSTHTAGGFVGCMYAMYATSNGVPSTNSASFSEFESKGE